jgi:class 3 adenylate cyclase
MFVDLVGSTELAAQLDPEDMAQVIRAYQRCCTEAVERWGGHVAKYMGAGRTRTRPSGPCAPGSR